MIADKDSTVNANTVNTNAINTTALAYMGDAVYEVYVRAYVLQKNRINVDQIHQAAVNYVRADSQAKALKAMFEGLFEEEKQLVKRARNRKTVSRPRNSDPVEYKLATAFEALLGYHYLAGNTDRLEALIAEAILVVDEVGNKEESK